MERLHWHSYDFINRSSSGNAVYASTVSGSKLKLIIRADIKKEKKRSEVGPGAVLIGISDLGHATEEEMTDK